MSDRSAVATIEARRLVLRPTRERPTLALPLDQPASVSYALERWSVVDRRWKTARMRAARILVLRGLFPSWASPVVHRCYADRGPTAGPGLRGARARRSE